MTEKISKKRIIYALLPLVFFNIVLLADIFIFKKMAWSAEKNEKKYEYGEDERIYTSEKTISVKDGDKTLFQYEGADANCYKKFDKDWQREACLREHPYGGQGTMTVGGNLAVENAQAIYLNGYDSAGYNWIMSTTSEPYGNTMGTRDDSGSSVYYGNHLLADGTIRAGGTHFRPAEISVIFNQRNTFMVADGVFEELGRMVFLNNKYKTNKDVFSIIEKGICGVCDETCSDGKAGKDYQFLAKNGLDVKETTKANEQVRLCGYTKECEMACCREAQYLVDDTYDNFVGATCSLTPCVLLPRDPYGMGPNYCYPQEYPHYTRQEKLPLSYSYHTEGGYNVRGGNGQKTAFVMPANVLKAADGTISWTDENTGKSYTLSPSGIITNVGTGETFAYDSASGDWKNSSDVAGFEGVSVDGSKFGLTAENIDAAIAMAATLAVSWGLPTPVSIAVTLGSYAAKHEITDFDSLVSALQSTWNDVVDALSFFGELVGLAETDVGGWVDPDTGAVFGGQSSFSGSENSGTGQGQSGVSDGPLGNDPGTSNGSVGL